MVKKEAIAVIPARGGSKRIPKKNILEFGGRPMIVWTIDAALASGLFDRVLVSTDDPETAEISVAAGAEAPFLRDSAADDLTPVSQATVRALAQAGKHWDETYRNIVQLMPNCPLRRCADIAAAYDYFSSNDVRFLISSFKFGWMNPWWAFSLDKGNVPSALFPKELKQRSQDLPDLYCPTGAIWIADVPALEKEGTFYGSGHRFFPISWQSAVDIDDYDDLEFAKAVLAGMDRS